MAAPNPNQPLDVIPLADSFLRAMQATEEMDKAVTNASSTLKTFRIGLERAEPLRAIADTVTDVLKKQAVRDAAAQFRAAGKGKLDEATKNQIRETFDVAAEAMRDGTDNAFDRALKTLEIREEYARRLTDETQKRIILDNIKQSRKLLKEQSKNSVGFFGETMDDIRQNYLMPFVDKLDNNFFGRMLKRFATDRLAAIRQEADERAKEAEKEARAKQANYEAEVEASNAAQNIRIAQDGEAANLVKERIQTELELAKAQGDIVKADALKAEQDKISDALKVKANQEKKVTQAKEQLVAAKISGDQQKIADAEAKMRIEMAAKQAAENEYQTKVRDAAAAAGISQEQVDAAFIEARKKSIQDLMDITDSGNEQVKKLYENIAAALEANPALNREDVFQKLQTNGGLGINAGLANEIAQGNLAFDDQGNLQRGSAATATMTAPPSPIDATITQPNIADAQVVPTTLASPETVGVLSNLLSQAQIMTRHLELSSDNLAEIALNTASLQQPQAAATAASVVPTPPPPPDALQAAAPAATVAGPTAAGATAGAGGVAVTVNMTGSTLGQMFGDLKDRALKFGNKIKANITEFASEAKKQATDFANELSSRVVAPRAEAAETEQRVTQEAAQETQKPDAKIGFLQKLFGGKLFESIKNGLAAFKGGLASALEGLSKGLKSMFAALGEGLKKLADPMVVQGALALALISVGLLAFAGAMYLFGQTNWAGALIGIGVFVAFAVALAVLAPMLAPVLPLMFLLADVLLVMSIALLVFAASMYVLGLAMQLFASVGLMGVVTVLALLAGLALLGPALMVAGVALLIAAPGFFLFGAALLSLGLGMMMFAGIGLQTLPVVLLLLGGLAMMAPWLALGGLLLLLAAPGYFLFGLALMALGLGLQMFAGVGLGELATAIALLGALALIAPFILIGSILLALASIGYLLFGAALISLGLGLQMFIGTAGAILPAIAILMALGLLAPLLYASSILLMLATPGFLLFGFALMALGAGLAAFVGTAGAILPAIAMLLVLGMFAPVLAIAGLLLLVAAPGFAVFGLALMVLGAGLKAFVGTAGAIFPAIALLLALGLMGPALFLSSLFLAAATPGLMIFSLALLTLGSALGAFAENAGGVLPAIAALAALAMLAPFLFFAGIALGFAAPGFILFGVAMVLLGTGLLLFSIAIAQMSEGLLGLLGIVALMPLIALGIGAMVLLLMPLVLPMLLVGGALLLFALAIMTFFKALASGAQAPLPSPEPAETTVTYNVAKMEIDNMPFSFPDFLINQQGGGGGSGTAETIVNLLNTAFQPTILNGGGGGGDKGDNKLRNDENTFRRVQERFYNSALI